MKLSQKTIFTLSVLLMVFAAQWAVPGAIIYQQETLRQEGTVHRFQVQPVDPYDVMRGRYVRLSLLADQALIPSDEENLQHGQMVYAIMSEDAQGFTTLEKLVIEPVANSIEVRIYYPSENTGQYRVRLPIDRYYLPEADAIEVDHLMSWRNRESMPQASVDVAVRNGKAAAVGLNLDGMPYRQWLEAHQEKAGQE